MTVLAARLAAAHPETNSGVSVVVNRLVDHEVGPQADSLRSFFAAVGFVFVIACANIAALQLARQVANAPAVRARMAFVAAQVAPALILAGGAVMAAESLVAQWSLHPGFYPRGVASLSVLPPQQKYATGDQVSVLYARLLEEARAVPGVDAASAASATPLSGEGAEPIDFRIVEAASAEHASLFTANYFNAAPEYFKTLRAPLMRGRDFDASDTTSATPVAIVNETFVRKYLGSAEPIGTRLRLARTGEVTTIVGVAGYVLRDLRPGATPAAEIYWPYTQRPRWVTMLVVRANDPAAAMSAVLQRVHGIDADIRVGTPRLMTDRVARSFRAPRFMLMLFGLSAGVAVLLSGIGVYGPVSYTFAQRTREIGIRVSLGASPAHILALIARNGFAAVLAGSVAGCVGLLALSRRRARSGPGDSHALKLSLAGGDRCDNRRPA